MYDALVAKVSASLTRHVSKAAALSGSPGPVFAQILNYFPLDAISGGAIQYAAWPLVSGTLSDTHPVTVLSTAFDSLYARVLARGFIRQGSGTAQDYLRLADLNDTALVNVRTSTAINGGARLEGVPGQHYVPAYTDRWVSDPGIPDLSISINVWRPDKDTPWRVDANATGGQRLEAALRYSGFRIVFIDPAPVSGREGWFAPELLKGFRTGSIDGVGFSPSPSDETIRALCRASAYVTVGRIVFTRKETSTIALETFVTPGPGPAPGPLLHHAAPPPLAAPPMGAGAPLVRNVLTLAPGLVLPAGDIIRKRASGGRGHHVRPAPSGGSSGTSVETDWDTGDLYSSLNAGCIVSAVPVSPLG